MSIQSEITRISGNVSDSLNAVSAKGVVVPSGSNSDDLASLIAQITGGGGSVIQDQDGYIVIPSTNGLDTPYVTASTTDITDGTTQLTTGDLYLVYEA